MPLIVPSSVAGKMRGYRFEPDGGIHGAKSLPDAIGAWLENQVEGRKP